MDLRKTNLRQGKKKVALFPEIGRVKNFLSNVYENIYFLFQKNTQKQQKNFHQQNHSYKFTFFFFQKTKNRALCFSTKKSAVRVVSKCKLYLKNSIKLIKKIFFQRPPGRRFFFIIRVSENKTFFFGPNTVKLFLSERTERSQSSEIILVHENMLLFQRKIFI